MRHIFSHLAQYRVIKSNVERLDLESVSPGIYTAEPLILVEAIDDANEVVARGIGSDAYGAVCDLANRLPRASFKSQPDNGTS